MTAATNSTMATTANTTPTISRCVRSSKRRGASSTFAARAPLLFWACFSLGEAAFAPLPWDCFCLAAEFVWRATSELLYILCLCCDCQTSPIIDEKPACAGFFLRSATNRHGCVSYLTLTARRGCSRSPSDAASSAPTVPKAGRSCTPFRVRGSGFPSQAPA